MLLLAGLWTRKRELLFLSCAYVINWSFKLFHLQLVYSAIILCSQFIREIHYFSSHTSANYLSMVSWEKHFLLRTYPIHHHYQNHLNHPYPHHHNHKYFHELDNYWFLSSSGRIFWSFQWFTVRPTSCFSFDLQFVIFLKVSFHPCLKSNLPNHY